MKNSLCLIALMLLGILTSSIAQENVLPIRGFAIAAPSVGQVDRFVTFMEEELRSRGVNTLVLRVDYNYEYESHPELRNQRALSKADITKLRETGAKLGINIVPQINLLGHQSWASKLENLLVHYPQFDETPHVQLPENYVWPNEDGLYCKSYCPLHPEVHGVVFALVDELCDAFGATDFHAGMDEVFYIGDDKCPRCKGLDKAALFAGEVTKIRNHLATKERKLWIWGDRLIDGSRTGIGMWEGSMNNTHQALDLIPKDVVICDWHYEKPLQTPVVFAMKGLDVISCSWNKPHVGVKHVEDMFRFREHNTPMMKDRFKGVMLTVWMGADSFLDGFYAYQNDPRAAADENKEWVTFIRMFEKLDAMASNY